MQIPSSGAAPESAPPWRVRLCRWLWKIFVAIGAFLVSVVGGNTFSTWLVSPKGIIPPDSPLMGGLVAHWLYTLLVGFCLILAALLVWILSRWPTELPFASSSQARQNRAVLLGRLRHDYQQYQEQSLQNVVKVELGLASRPDAIQNAVHLLLRLPNRPERVLSPGASIVQVYEEANHELLILGEPGAGKSTLLVSLAQHLVERAEREETHPLPILLLLSSWAVRRPRMQDWLIEQLSQVYNVPRQLSQQLVREEQILLLLDGLDEMEETARVACVTEINAYHHEHLLVPLVICSRTAEYERATVTERLALQSSVVVQPLTSGQIDAALASVGTSVAGLCTELTKNSTLAELATTPLLLDVLLLVYQGKEPRGLSRQRKALLQQVWDTYVKQMIGRKGDKQRYPGPQTIRWLGWLAQLMREHNQTVFFLEHLQPDWLPKRPKAFYQWSVGLVGALLGVLVIWLSGGLSGGLSVDLVIGLVIWLVGGLVGGLLVGLMKIAPAGDLTWSWEKARSKLRVGLRVGLPGGLPSGLRRWLVFGLVFGLVVGLVLGLFSGLSRGLLVGLVVGLVVGLAGGLGAAVQYYALRFWLWRTHTFPWRAVSFLKDATARILLRRVGGGYSFTHRLLLDHFADLDLEASSGSSKAQPTE